MVYARFAPQTRITRCRNSVHTSAENRDYTDCMNHATGKWNDLVQVRRSTGIAQILTNADRTLLNNLIDHAADDCNPWLLGLVIRGCSELGYETVPVCPNPFQEEATGRPGEFRLQCRNPVFKFVFGQTHRSRDEGRLL